MTLLEDASTTAIAEALNYCSDNDDDIAATSAPFLFLEGLYSVAVMGEIPRIDTGLMKLLIDPLITECC